MVAAALMTKLQNPLEIKQGIFKMKEPRINQISLWQMVVLFVQVMGKWF